METQKEQAWRQMEQPQLRQRVAGEALADAAEKMAAVAGDVAELAENRVNAYLGSLGEPAMPEEPSQMPQGHLGRVQASLSAIGASLQRVRNQLERM